MVLRFRRRQPAVDSRGKRTPLNATYRRERFGRNPHTGSISRTGFVSQHTTSHERIVMTLPVTAEFVDPAARRSLTFGI
jgi:hypothetical protein